jgi:hypothetical protein
MFKGCNDLDLTWIVCTDQSWSGLAADVAWVIASLWAPMLIQNFCGRG